MQGLGILNFPARVRFIIIGLLLAVPEWRTDLLGLGMAGALVAGKLYIKRHQNRSQIEREKHESVS